jgi:hypothetical protein
MERNIDKGDVPNKQARRVKRQSQTHHLDATVKESMRGVPTVQSDRASLEIPDVKFRCTRGVDGNGHCEPVSEPRAREVV